MPAFLFTEYPHQDVGTTRSKKKSRFSKLHNCNNMRAAGNNKQNKKQKQKTIQIKKPYFFSDRKQKIQPRDSLTITAVEQPEPDDYLNHRLHKQTVFETPS